MELTYYGQSAFELSDGDVTVVIDPWITESPHTETTVDAFDDVDAVLVTHGAFDHVGDAPEIARRNDAELFSDAATHTVLTQHRGFPEELADRLIWGIEIEREGWSFKVVDSRHHSAWTEYGLISGSLAYIVTIGDEVVYHMGDTAIFKTLELYGELYEPTTSLVPVGAAPGYHPELYPDEAALVAEWLDSDVVVPMHYAPGSERPDEFEEHCRARGVDERSEIARMEPDTTIEL